LSSQAAAGQQLSRTSGCAACHGHDGEGGAGPAFAGLYGSKVALADGTTVVADDGYLTDAIRDPDATRVEGYDVGMPASDLSEAQIASIIAYIRELTVGPAK
jgi:cytochrome c oxidase subunit 2